MGFYKRNRSLFLVLLGTGLMTASVCWEYARMQPDYRYIVKPWSLRGFETTQGWVILAGSLAVLALAVPLSLRLLKGGLVESIVSAALVTAFATVVPVLADAPDVTASAIVTWGLAVLLGLAGMAVLGRVLPASMPGWSRRLSLFGAFAGLTVLAGVLAYARLLAERSVPLWVIVLILMLTCDVIVITRAPTELAAYRLLLLGVSLVWLVSLVSGGAVRSTLLRLQTDTGIFAEYRDIQITSGILIAWAGGLFGFAGAVALWARRRDELQERHRAGQQLAVAALSATELEQAV